MKKIIKIIFTLVIILSLVKMCDVEALTLTKIDVTRIYTVNYTLLAECLNTTSDTSIANRCATSSNGVHFISSSIFTNLRYNSTYNMKFQVSYGGADVQFADVNSFGMYLIDASGRNQGNITCESGGWSNETDSTTQFNWIVHNIDCDFQVNVNNIKGIGFNQTMNSIQGVQFYLESDIQVNLLNSDAAIIENQNQNQQQTNEKLDDVNENLSDIDNTLKDDSTDNDKVEDTFSLIEERMAKNGTITNLVILPVTLFSKISNSVNGSCQDFSLGELFGNEISFPCIDISDYLGQSVWSTIDILFTGFFIFVIAKKMVKVFDTFTSLQEGDILD